MKSYQDIQKFLIKNSLCFIFCVCFLQNLYASRKDSIRILFIGNSYTYAGMGETNPEIPFRIKEMAAYYGKAVATDFVVKPGALLEKHWKEGNALKLIETNHYDFVVLQDQSSVTLRNVKTFRTYATKFDSVIKKSGSVTVLYMTWGYANRPLMGDTIQYEYNRLGKDLGALVAPCGLAWKIYFKNNPGKELHISDKSHPRREGVYLSATVLYKTMLGKLPKGKMYFIKEEKGTVIDGDLAKKLRLAAEEALKENKNYRSVIKSIRYLDARLLLDDGKLVFQTGFEGSSTLIADSKNIPSFITPGYVIDDIAGVDSTLREKNDWEKDLDYNPDGGQFLIEYTGGDSTQRYVKIIPEPGNPKNHVLQFWLNDSWHASEGQQKARIQTDIYGIKKGFKEIYQAQRVFLTEDFNVLKTYPGKFGWLTISEFWNNEWWVKDEPYGFRTTLGIEKPKEGESDLYFKLDAENAGQKQVWNAGDQPKVKVPIGKWFTMEYYVKEGNKETGRFYMTITPDGEPKQVVFDVTNFTHNTYDPAPNGFTGWSPQKLYTSKELVGFVKSKGKTLQIYWDDFKLWREK